MNGQNQSQFPNANVGQLGDVSFDRMAKFFAGSIMQALAREFIRQSEALIGPGNQIPYLGGGEPSVSKPTEEQELDRPPLEELVKPEYVVCLEDGKRFKTLSRHLRAEHGMTPEEYRTKWNLPKDFPMTCGNLIEMRKETAKRIGLGHLPGAGRKPKNRPEPDEQETQEASDNDNGRSNEASSKNNEKTEAPASRASEKTEAPSNTPKSRSKSSDKK